MSTVQPPSTCLSADLRCIRCGYDLRGIDHDGMCPECGLAIERTLTLGRELRDSRPAWIATLAIGAALLLAAQFLLVAFPVFVASRMWSGQAAWTWLVAIAAANWIGSALLTRRENPFARSRRDARLAPALRTCALALVASIVVVWALSETMTYAPGASPRPHIYAIGPAVLFAPCPALQFAILRRLAKRVLDRRLMEYSTIVGIGYPLGLVLMLLLVPVLGSFSLNCRPAFLLALLALTLVPLFWLWSIVAFACFAAAFARAAREARAAWRRADASEAAGEM